MRAAPAFQISLQRFGVWRAAVWVLALLAAAAIGAWLSASSRPVGGAALGAAAAAGLGLVALAASLVRLPHVLLRWDGQRWHLGMLGATPDDSVSGDLRVAVDLGPWMLLRFRPAPFERHPPLIWLPVQRRGVEAQWHALRCAVYSPRPSLEAGPAASP